MRPPQSEQERQAAVVRAEGEAEAATIISRALSKAGDGLVQFRRIEASKEIAGTLAQVCLSLSFSLVFSPLSLLSGLLLVSKEEREVDVSKSWTKLTATTH
jgi:regulator of protease activity HflC (stomatin/prohibitin superfamily)